MNLVREEIQSPIGTLVMVSNGEAVCALGFADQEARKTRFLDRRFGAVELQPADMPSRFAAALEAYFAGNIDALDTIPVDSGGTPFQQQVWTALRRIPAGRTTSYGALAAGIGRPTAVRAVGAANGSNPIAVIVPCHRVIGADGSLTGYGGGIERKRWLLAHEAAAGN